MKATTNTEISADPTLSNLSGSSRTCSAKGSIVDDTCSPEAIACRIVAKTCSIMFCL